MITHSPIPQTIVTDSNLWLHAAIPAHPYHLNALNFVRHCAASTVRFIVPVLWESEVDSGVRKMFSAHNISEVVAIAALRWIDSASVESVHYSTLRFSARKIADIIQAPRVYDATYAALAYRMGCDLWTADQRFFNAINNAQIAAAKRHSSVQLPEVRFIAEYAGEYA